MTDGVGITSRISPHRAIQLVIIVMMAFAVFFGCLFALRRIKMSEDEKKKRSNDSVQDGQSAEKNNTTSIVV